MQQLGHRGNSIRLSLGCVTGGLSYACFLQQCKRSIVILNSSTLTISAAGTVLSKKADHAKLSCKEKMWILDGEVVEKPNMTD